MASIVGRDVAETLRQRSLDVYRRAAEYAARSRHHSRRHEIRVGPCAGAARLILIDEVLTPDSSRFWPADEYRVGVSPPSFDKQIRARLVGDDAVGQEQSAAGVARGGGREDAAEVSRSVSTVDGQGVALIPVVVERVRLATLRRSVTLTLLRSVANRTTTTIYGEKAKGVLRRHNEERLERSDHIHSNYTFMTS